MKHEPSDKRQPLTSKGTSRQKRMRTDRSPFSSAAATA